MKKTILVLLSIFMLVSVAFAASTKFYCGVSPYSFQHILKFYPKNTVNSLYSVGAQAGVKYIPKNWFSMSAEMNLQDYFFENKVNEFVLTINGRIGYCSNWNTKFGLTADIGVGGSLCAVKGMAKLYLNTPVEIGTFYNLNNKSQLYFKVKGDCILMFADPVKYSSISILVSPVIGYSFDIKGGAK